MSDYCQAHLSQHELQAGFLAAIHTFSKEVFTDETLKFVEFDNLKLGIMNPTEGLIVATVVDVNDKKKHVAKLLDKISKLFIEEYGEEIKKPIVELNIYEPFREKLRESKVINQLGNVAEMNDITKVKNKPKLVSWLQSIRSSVRSVF